MQTIKTSYQNFLVQPIPTETAVAIEQSPFDANLFLKDGADLAKPGYMEVENRYA